MPMSIAGAGEQALLISLSKKENPDEKKPGSHGSGPINVRDFPQSEPRCYQKLYKNAARSRLVLIKTHWYSI
jgi:hypothetical protein